MIDYNYYHNEFGGRYGTEIVPYLRRAYRLITACLTVPADDSMIADSVCVQAEYMTDDGSDEIRLGDFAAKSRRRGDISPEALICLEKYGLLYRGGVS
ncbi:MAG: hypothetical protein J6I96_01695 [Oscillospiraceae bacterium]|nr:hypothetical protein [Oscillospiraceae bacterium]